MIPLIAQLAVFSIKGIYVTGQSKRGMSDALLSYTWREHACTGFIYSCSPFSNVQEEGGGDPECTLSHTTAVWQSNKEEALEIHTWWRLQMTSEGEAGLQNACAGDQGWAQF